MVDKYRSKYWNQIHFKKRASTIIFSIGILLVVLLSSCSNSTESIGKKDTLRIGYFPNVTHAPAMVGIEAGIFESQFTDITISYQSFATGNLLMDALATGKIDIGYVGPGPVINRYLQGAKVQILAGVTNGGMVLVANPSSEIRSITDIEGKIISTQAIGDSRDIMLRYLLKENNLALEQAGGNVRHRIQSAATIQSAFSQNQLDAVMAPEPWASVLEENGANVILDWNEMPYSGEVPASIIVTSESFATNNPELIERFLQAHKESMEYITQNKEESLRMVQKQILTITQQELSIEILEKSLIRSPLSYEINASAFEMIFETTKEMMATSSNKQLENLFYKKTLEIKGGEINE